MNLDWKDFSWSPMKKFTAAATSLALIAGCSSNGETNEVQTSTSSSGRDDEANIETQIDPKNIVYITLDDSGFSDFASYGSEISTPNVDALAEDGLRYNNFHVNPTCSPTRAALLTGRNSHAVGMGTVANFDLRDEYPNKRGEIVDEAATIGEVLKEHDFNNYALGKWHLSPSYEATAAGPYNNWPLGKGFDRYYGFLEDSTDQYKPEMVMDNSFVGTIEEGSHLSGALVDQANQFITDHESLKDEDPFFVYLNFGAQHQPVQVPDEYIEMYDGVYDKGWDVIREERFERQKELGIIQEDAELPHDPQIQSWDELTDDQKKAFTRYQEAYAGFLTHTDEQIGRFLDHLEELGAMEDTIIVVTSDNGASALGGENGSVNHTRTFNVMTPDMEEVMESYEDIGTKDAKAEFPLGWAQVSNTPFKDFKSTGFEGGIRVPLIFYHPEIEDEYRGEIREQYVHVSDITPTIYELLGIELPEEVNGVEQMPLHGESFAESIRNPDAEGKETQYYEHNGQRSIYHDGWKAVGIRTVGQPFEDDEWQLYHVAEDPTETHNLVEEEPEKLEELKQTFETEGEKYNVFPMGDAGPDGFLSAPEGTLRTKDEFTFYPGMSQLPEGASPLILNRSYSITAPIDRESAEEEGVIVALGGYQSGYTFYIKDNHLVFEYNIGEEIYRVESDAEVPTGEVEVEMRFENSGDHQGVANLFVNDEKVGEGEVKQTHPFKLSFEGLSVGKDSLNPVTPSYEEEGEFEFSGELEKVMFSME